MFRFLTIQGSTTKRLNMFSQFANAFLENILQWGVRITNHLFNMDFYKFHN